MRKVKESFILEMMKMTISGSKFDNAKFDRFIKDRWVVPRTKYGQYECRSHGTKFFYSLEGVDEEASEPCWPCYEECVIRL